MYQLSGFPEKGNLSSPLSLSFRVDVALFRLALTLPHGAFWPLFSDFSL